MGETGQTIIDIIKAQISKKDSLPILSRGSLALQSEITKKEPDTQKIIRLIMMEPALTGDILRMANAPFYRGLEQVKSVKEAALRIGFNELFKLSMTAIHKANFQSKDPLVKKIKKRLWRHSLACAIGSNWLTKHLELEFIAPQSFIAGLLHDMGKLYLLTAIEKLRGKKNSGFNPSDALIYKILDNLHTGQGFELLTIWHIPEEYTLIARDHHNPKFDQSNLLMAVVRLVDTVINKMEKIDPDEDTGSIAASDEADILGVGEIAIAELEIAVEEAMERFI